MYIFVQLVLNGSTIVCMEFAEVDIDWVVHLHCRMHLLPRGNNPEKGISLTKAMKLFAYTISNGDKIIFFSQREYDVFISQAKRYLSTQCIKRSYCSTRQHQVGTEGNLLDKINNFATTTNSPMEYLSKTNTK